MIFLCDGDGQDRRPAAGRQPGVLRAAGASCSSSLLTEVTELGVAYRVDLRLRPDGSQGRAVISVEAALQYYDVSGRTWERQAFVKARPIAGDIELGASSCAARALDLSALPDAGRHHRHQGAEAAHRTALGRRRGRRANVKTGHGGIRDIEFVIQFLQLLNGGDLPEVRTGNTLEAIDGSNRAAA